MQTLQEIGHLFIPINFLDSFPNLIVGNLALHNIFLRFGGCLSATIGGDEKISFMCLFLVMKFQCLLTTFVTLGSIGLYVMANTDLSVLTFSTRFKAFFLSIFEDLSIAAFIMFLL